MLEVLEAGLVDRLLRGQAAALALDGEIDQHDAVLLDDADQQDETARTKPQCCAP